MNIAVLGKGFIGTYVVNHLSKNHNIFWYDQASFNYQEKGKLSYYIKTFNIDTVVNTSGYTGFPNVDGCEDNKSSCMHYNVTVPLIIEDECKKGGAKLIHISSGCIYTGYDKIFTEEDEPNFGINSNESSFYSKTKHLCEKVLDINFTNILRIRMPISPSFEHKNLLTKLLKYDNLIDYKNSKTDVFVLAQLVETICLNFKPGIYNAVHSETLSTSEVVDILSRVGLINDNWKFIPYSELDIKANRSNCILSNEKIKKDFDFNFGDESFYIALNSTLIYKEGKWKERV